MKRFISVITLLCMLVSLFTLSAYADNYLVKSPSDFAKVLSEAKDGDIIKLDAGEYTMPQSVSAQNLTIQGAGESSTLIKFPLAYTENSSISFTDVTLDKSALGGGSGSGSGSESGVGSGGSMPKLKMLKSGGVPTASVNGTSYSSIQEAVANAASGDTVVVTSSGTLDADDIISSDSTFIKVDGDRAITIDLNGCTISVNAGTTAVDSVVLVKSGSLTMIDSLGGGIAVYSDDGNVEYIFLCRASGKLTICSGNYTANKLGDSLIYSSGSEIVSVEGGNFYLGNTGTGANGSPWIFNASGRGSQHIHVSGGTYNTNVLNQFWRFEVQKPDNGFMAVKEENGTFTIVAPTVIQREKEGAYWYPAGYDSLDDAVNAANGITLGYDVPTTTIIADTSLETSVTATKKIVIQDGKSVTLTLGKDKTLTGSGSGSIIDIPDGSKLTIAGEGRLSNNGSGAFSALFPGATIDELKEKLVIIGGTWEEDPHPFMPDGAKAEQNPDGTWSVTPPPKPVAPAAPAAKTAASSYYVPLTGDNSSMPLWSCLFILFAVTAILTGKKRRS